MQDHGSLCPTWVEIVRHKLIYWQRQYDLDSDDIAQQILCAHIRLYGTQATVKFLTEQGDVAMSHWLLNGPQNDHELSVNLLISSLAAMPSDLARTTLNELFHPLGFVAETPKTMFGMLGIHRRLELMMDTTAATIAFTDFLEEANANDLQKLAQELNQAHATIMRRQAAINCMLMQVK